MAKYSDLFEDKYKEALKSKDPQTVSVLRLLKAAFVNERIAKGHELSDEEEAAVIRREIKKRDEASEIFRQGGSEEKAGAEKFEADYLKSFLPAELSDAEIRQIVEKVSAGQDNFGKIMGEAMKEVAGRASGDRVGKIVKEKLGK